MFGPPRDHEQSITVLRRAIELGINHIDTSQYYGPNVSNELIREVLHPYPADLALVSKVGARRDDARAWLPAQAPDELRAGIEENLHTLDVDRVAAANLRVVSGDRPSTGPVDRGLFDQQLTAMMKARDEGLIAGIGLSSFSLEHLQIASKLGHTPAQIALAWTLSVAPNILLIPGTSSVQHLEENTAVADIELDDETLQHLNAIHT